MVVTKLEFGKAIVAENAFKRLPDILERNDYRNIWVFSGSTATYRIAKKISRDITDYLSEDFKEPYRIPRASPRYVKKVRKIIRRYRPEHLLAFGGGQPIDVVKKASYNEGVSWISCPTSLGHDGIANDRARIRGATHPYSEKAAPPELVIIDIEEVFKAPKRYNLAGFGDAIKLYTSVRDWKLAWETNKGGFNTVPFDRNDERELINSVDKLTGFIRYKMRRDIKLNRESKDYKGVLYRQADPLLKSSNVMIKNDSSQPASGSEHLFSHALSVYAPGANLHGEQVAYGTRIMLWLDEEEKDGNPYGMRSDDLERIWKFINGIRHLNIDEKIQIRALGKKARKIGQKRGRYTILEDIPINIRLAERAIEEINKIRS